MLDGCRDTPSWLPSRRTISISNQPSDSRIPHQNHSTNLQNFLTRLHRSTTCSLHSISTCISKWNRSTKLLSATQATCSTGSDALFRATSTSPRNNIPHSKSYVPILDLKICQSCQFITYAIMTLSNVLHSSNCKQHLADPCTQVQRRTNMPTKAGLRNHQHRELLLLPVAMTYIYCFSRHGRNNLYANLYSRVAKMHRVYPAGA